MKGVSPVVSTVLIVAIAIAIAVVAYSWFMSVQATLQAEASKGAATVGRDKIMIEGVKCVNSNNLEIYVRNIGDDDINGLFTIYVREPSTGGILDHNASNYSVSAGSVKTFTVEVNGLSGCEVSGTGSEYVVVEVITPGGSSYRIWERIGGINDTNS